MVQENLILFYYVFLVVGESDGSFELSCNYFFFTASTALLELDWEISTNMQIRVFHRYVVGKGGKRE